jgi:RimJ/RimL family protein N-acetyltransferase
MAVLEVERPATTTNLNWREGLPLLVTPRAVLREVRRSDATPLWKVARSPEVSRYSWPAPTTVDKVESFITQAWRERAEGKYACFAVVPRDQTDPAGMLELRSLHPGFLRAELGLLMDPTLWDSAVFQDGMRLVCEFSFKTLGVRRIEIRTSVANTRCNDALTTLGVQQEATMRAAFMHNDQYEDQFLWSLLGETDRLTVTV